MCGWRRLRASLGFAQGWLTRAVHSVTRATRALPRRYAAEVVNLVGVTGEMYTEAGLERPAWLDFLIKAGKHNHDRLRAAISSA